MRCSAHFSARHEKSVHGHNAHTTRCVLLDEQYPVKLLCFGLAWRPLASTAALAVFTSSGFSSYPTPVALWFSAAAINRRPSPQPMSCTCVEWVASQLQPHRAQSQPHCAQGVDGPFDSVQIAVKLQRGNAPLLLVVPSPSSGALRRHAEASGRRARDAGGTRIETMIPTTSFPSDQR